MWQVREKCAYAALEDVKKWIKENSGQVRVVGFHAIIKRKMMTTIEFG